MKLSLIVAVSENNIIGDSNQIPWHLPADLRHFKAITTGHPIIMGRKTYQSIGRALPNRRNIIVTRNTDFAAPGCTVVNSLESALAVAQEEISDEVFVIGGAAIYALALPSATTLYLTRVHVTVQGDTSFDFAPEDWEVITTERHAADEKNAYAYSFITLQRR